MDATLRSRPVQCWLEDRVISGDRVLSIGSPGLNGTDRKSDFLDKRESRPSKILAPLGWFDGQRAGAHLLQQERSRADFDRRLLPDCRRDGADGRSWRSCLPPRHRSLAGWRNSTSGPGPRPTSSLKRTELAELIVALGEHVKPAMSRITGRPTLHWDSRPLPRWTPVARP